MKLSFCKKLLVSAFLLSFSFLCFCQTHTVEKGDTLYSISKKYSITVDSLKKENNLLESDVIKIGQKLKIPSAISSSTSSSTSKTLPKEHVVEKGETLYSISKKYGLKVAELMSINGLEDNSVIKIGQKIKLSGNFTSSTSTSSNTTVASKTSTNTSTSNTTTTTIPIQDTRSYGKTVTSDSNTIWPVKNPTVTAVKGKVNGVQLSAAKNESVTCIREGSVMYIGVYRGYGQIIFVQSKTGIIYAYAGLNTISVKKGDYVVFGKELGTAGVDSITGKSQITFMVFQNGQSIDPAKAPRS